MPDQLNIGPRNKQSYRMGGISSDCLNDRRRWGVAGKEPARLEWVPAR
jgi:hypothetical protein